MKIKTFECPKSIRNYEKKILGTSDAWSTSRLFHRPSEPAYYIGKGKKGEKTALDRKITGFWGSKKPC